MTNTPQDIAIEPIIEWIRNNYQDHSIDSLCEELRAQWFERRFDIPAAPAHPQVAAVVPKAQIDPNSREAQMVTLRMEDGEPTVWCDPEIADLVDALNTDKLATIASCSGHGHRPGSIALKDGRWLFVATEDQRQVIEATFPVDVNGAVVPKAQAEAVGVRLPPFEVLSGLDKAQDGYQWRMGWNEALRRVMDYNPPAAIGHKAEAAVVPKAVVTEEMVTAYLTANDAYWRETDKQPTKLTKWRNGTPSEATRVSLEAALAVVPKAQAESRCANCGKPASEAEKVISEYPEEGEWFCSDECHDQHSELGCPHEHHDGYRHPAEARRLIECEEALRSLASWLGVGGYNAPAVDAKEFEAKIRDGVEHIQTRPRSAAEGYLAMWGPLLARAQAGAGGVAEAALRELIEARDAFAASALAEDRAGCLVGAQEQIDKHLQADMRLKFAWIAARDAITPAPQAREAQAEAGGVRELTEDEAVAVDFYRLNPSAALCDLLRCRLSTPAPQQSTEERSFDQR